MYLFLSWVNEPKHNNEVENIYISQGYNSYWSQANAHL